VICSSKWWTPASVQNISLADTNKSGCLFGIFSWALTRISVNYASHEPVDKALTRHQMTRNQICRFPSFR